MDPELMRLIKADTPELNKAIADGLAVTHVPGCEIYVDQLFRSAAKSFPEGLVYKGGRQCTPIEEYREITKKRNTRSVFDIARSDFYMMQYHFSYRGIDLPPRYLLLPFVGDAGCITIGGSRFNIAPVLADKVISVGLQNIFVRLLKARLTFDRIPYYIEVDGRKKTVPVFWSKIHNKEDKTPNGNRSRITVKAHSTMMHYLLGKYGFTDTFLKFGNCSPIVGGPEINRNVYSEEEWVICASSQFAPKGRSKGFYRPSQNRVAVPRKDWSPMVEQMITGYFYIVDHFPERTAPEHSDHKGNWRILLGKIYFPSATHEGKLASEMADHFESLDEYIDGLTHQKLTEIGLPVDDMYQLCALIIQKFNEWLTDGADKVSSMYDKEVNINYFLLYQISSAIFTMGFKLKSASKKGVLTADEIKAIMNSSLRTGLIFSINRDHGEVMTISYPGDNKALKITSMLVPQSKTNRRGKKKDRTALSDPTRFLHVSVAEVGGYSNLPKSEPSGRERINQHASLSPKGLVLRNPARQELLDSIQEDIQR